LHVYVVASKPWRVRFAVERMGIEPGRVEKALEETDRHRDEYVKTYYGRVRREAANYDLVVNAERLGLDGAAALVMAEANRRGWT
jgi:cytidylate kinase